MKTLIIKRSYAYSVNFSLKSDISSLVKTFISAPFYKLWIK